MFPGRDGPRHVWDIEDEESHLAIVLEVKSKLARLLLVVTLFLSLPNGVVNAAKNGGPCRKVGLLEITKQVLFVCTKSGSKRVWKQAEANDFNQKTTTSTATTTSTTIPKSCANGGSCVLGETGPGGGKVFFVYIPGFACGLGKLSKCKYLEAAPVTGPGAWYDLDLSWSAPANHRIGVPQAFYGGGIQFGAGFQNSLDIANQTGNDTTNSAAVAARAYRGPNNLSDWFLPSSVELLELYNNYNSVENFPRTSGSLYWSSSEAGPSVVFVVGNIKSGGNWLRGFVTREKLLKTYVRPVRAFG